MLGVLFFLAAPSIKNILFTKTLTQGVIGTHTEEDLPLVVTNLLSSGLVIVDENGEAKPNLANGWQANKEAKEYVFKLKDNLFWSDGTLSNAQDIALSIPDAEITTPDDKTINFKLTDSFSPLPTLLSKPILKKGTHIGIGPYSIEKIDKSQIFIKRIILRTSNKDLPKLIIRFYPNEKIAKNALRIGEVQSLLNVSDANDLVDENPFAIWSKTNYQRLVAIFYNTKDPLLSDRNLRLALSFSAPTVKGEDEAKTTISPHSFAFNSDVKDYLDNPKQAKEYLSKVEKIEEKTITLTATSNLKQIGEQIVDGWNKNGIKAVLRIESGIPQNFQALLISQNIPIDPDQYSLWHSTQVQTNISKYSSPEQFSPRVDKDLEDGRKSLEKEIRKEKYFDFQKVLLDDAPATPLYFPKYNVIYLNKIEGDLKKVLEIQLPELLSN